MRVQPIKNEEDVTRLKAGDHILINNEPFMFRNRSLDGGEYLRRLGNGNVHRIHIRGYRIFNDGIVPAWYSEKIIPLSAGGGA